MSICCFMIIVVSLFSYLFCIYILLFIHYLIFSSPLFIIYLLSIIHFVPLIIIITLFSLFDYHFYSLIYHHPLLLLIIIYSFITIYFLLSISSFNSRLFYAKHLFTSLDHRNGIWFWHNERKLFLSFPPTSVNETRLINRVFFTKSNAKLGFRNQ